MSNDERLQAMARRHLHQDREFKAWSLRMQYDFDELKSKVSQLDARTSGRIEALLRIAESRAS